MTDEIITQIIPLAYIDAQTVSTQLRSILRDSNPVPFQTTNSLIVTDTGNKIRRLLEIIRLLDVKGNQPQVAILAVKHTDANDIGKKIQDVFGARGGGAALYLQKVIVDERTNSLILIGPPRGLDDVVRLINRLDKPLDDASAQNQIHVRPLDYADSEKLSATLQALAQGQAAARRRPPNAPPIQNLGSQSADIGGVKITSDKSTNSLIVQGSNAQFKEIDTIIRQLDKRRDQVYVEADVLDVNVGNDLQLATSFIAGASAANGRANVPFGWKSGNIAPFIVNRDNPTDADKSLLLSAIPTSAYIGALSTSKIKIGGIELSPGAFIFALKQDSNSNVLQTPSLLVADNEEANFDATEREYLLTSTEDPVSKTRSQKLENLDASLGIKIKPQVSKADFVSMDITIKAESFGTRDSDNKPKQINKRSVQTKITTQNGQTIVISGLQRDIEIESKSKVPLLGDLPIIGWLFRNLNTVKNKTSLMVFLTPHVIRSSEDLAKIYERKVRERDEFLKAFYGEDFRKRPVFKRMSRLEDGKVPPPRADLVTPADAPTVGPTAPADANHKLPSEDPNPIVVPSSGAMGAPVFSGGGDIGGGAVPPPPPPPPAPADGQ